MAIAKGWQYFVLHKKGFFSEPQLKWTQPGGWLGDNQGSRR